MWVFVNALIENPSFDSQTKENMTLQTKSFGSKCLLSEKFVRAVRRLLVWTGSFFLLADEHIMRLGVPTGHQLWDCGEHPQLGEVQGSDSAE